MVESLAAGIPCVCAPFAAQALASPTMSCVFAVLN
jgi:hypothetical protein